MSGRGKCPDCDAGLFEGNGNCSRCHGTGVNTQLDSAQPRCPNCSGTGVCPGCGGTGLYDDGDASPFQTLFV